MQVYVLIAASATLVIVAALAVRELRRMRKPALPAELPSEPAAIPLVASAPPAAHADAESTRLAPLARIAATDPNGTAPESESETKAVAWQTEDSAADSATGPAKFFVAHAVGQTDVGKKRKRNEDAYAIRAVCGLYVVADGMGGHDAGDLASRIAVQTIAGHFEREEFPALRKQEPELPRRAVSLVSGIESANTAVFEAAAASDALSGMGTTIVAAQFLEQNNRVVLAHVGDSRGYRLRAGEFKQLTVDHTLAQKGVEGPQGKFMRRAVGVRKKVYVDVVYDVPQLRDRYLLCSDGLTRMLSDVHIRLMLGAAPDAATAANLLVSKAVDAGGRDNVTVIVIDVLDVVGMRTHVAAVTEFGGSSAPP